MLSRNAFRLTALAAVSLMFSAGVAPRAAAASSWTVIVGGQTPDVSVYANGFFPRELTIHTGDTVTWQFAGFHNVSFMSGAAAPRRTGRRQIAIGSCFIFAKHR